MTSQRTIIFCKGDCVNMVTSYPLEGHWDSSADFRNQQTDDLTLSTLFSLQLHTLFLQGCCFGFNLIINLIINPVWIAITGPLMLFRCCKKPKIYTTTTYLLSDIKAPCFTILLGKNEQVCSMPGRKHCMGNNPFMLFLTLAPRTDLSLIHSGTTDTTFLSEFNSPSAAFTSAPNHLNLKEERLGLTKNQTWWLCRGVANTPATHLSLF